MMTIEERLYAMQWAEHEDEMYELVSSASEEDATAMLAAMQRLIGEGLVDHASHSEPGRHCNCSFRWPSEIKRALEERLGVPHTRYGVNAEGWFWS